MVSAINNAVSGLNAASTQLNVSANNIANQFTKPYTPQKINQVSSPNGGLQAKAANVNPPTVTVADPSSSNGTSQLPNVDTAQQLVNQQIASYDFQANVKTIKTANDTLQSLLDIKT